jgi:hypothetical protein
MTETNNRGSIALLCAADHGHLPRVQWLLRVGGATVGEATTHGSTALLVTAARGHLHVMWWLIQTGGAKCGRSDNQSSASLHYSWRQYMREVRA